ncbi:erythrocyte membrane protein 1 [Plasmodium falciparum RAJ116]|nr:erythrocyte membrane protein 1 [Plasmodium falciparum RAJ116]
MITSTEGVFMTVSDNSDHKFDDGLKDCQHAGIFKGIRKDVWTCGNVCGYVVCKPKEGNRETASGENKDQIITIRALVTHWVQNFLEDYKKIKHKFLNCTKNGQSKCINGCNNKCTCVETWISTKKGEWKNIKERFIEQYKGEPSDEYFNVRSCLETFIPQIPVADVKNEVIKLSQFDNSCGCSFSAHKQKDSNQDSIECMIKNLEKKIDECKTQHYPSGKPEEQCKEPPP